MSLAAPLRRLNACTRRFAKIRALYFSIFIRVRSSTSKPFRSAFLLFRRTEEKNRPTYAPRKPVSCALPVRSSRAVFTQLRVLHTPCLPRPRSEEKTCCGFTTTCGFSHAFEYYAALCSSVGLSPRRVSTRNNETIWVCPVDSCLIVAKKNSKKTNGRTIVILTPVHLHRRDKV